MAFENNVGTNHLARVLTKRMKLEGETSLILDFGTIESDYSLTTNTFAVKIPKGQYSICRTLTFGTEGSKIFGNIETSLPASMRSVKAGDRVLVGWVFNEAVVIDIIVSSNQL